MIFRVECKGFKGGRSCVQEAQEAPDAFEMVANGDVERADTSVETHRDAKRQAFFLPRARIDRKRNTFGPPRKFGAALGSGDNVRPTQRVLKRYGSPSPAYMRYENEGFLIRR